MHDVRSLEAEHRLHELAIMHDHNALAEQANPRQRARTRIEKVPLVATKLPYQYDKTVYDLDVMYLMVGQILTVRHGINDKMSKKPRCFRYSGETAPGGRTLKVGYELRVV